MATASDQPGFFHLDLITLDQQHPDRDGIENRMKCQQQLLKTISPVLVTAIRNLIGIKLCSFGQYELALEEFLKVLEVDKNNLNALEHCRAMMEKLDEPQNARQYRMRIQEVQRSDQVMGQMLLEQAYAYTYEAAHKAGKDRLQKALVLFTRGLQMRQNLPQAEKLEWMLCQGYAYQKLLDALFLGKDHTMIKKTFSTALKFLHDMCAVAVGLESEAHCWAELGRVLSKPPHQQQNIDKAFIAGLGLAEYLAKPGLCFEKALAIKPHDNDAACSYAKYTLRKHRTPADLKKALDIMDAVVDAKGPADLPWTVYSFRAEVLLACYETAKSAANMEYLKKALEDYAKVDALNDITAKRNIDKIKQYLKKKK